MKKHFQLWHQPVHEAAVLADAVAAHRRGPGRQKVAQEIKRLFFCLNYRDFAGSDAIPEPGNGVLMGIPLIHFLHHRFGLVDCKHRPDPDLVEILVGNYSGDFNNSITVRIKPGHFQINPNEVFQMPRHLNFLVLRLGCCGLLYQTLLWSTLQSPR